MRRNEDCILVQLRDVWSRNDVVWKILSHDVTDAAENCKNLILWDPGERTPMCWNILRIMCFLTALFKICPLSILYNNLFFILLFFGSLITLFILTIFFVFFIFSISFNIGSLKTKIMSHTKWSINNCWMGSAVSLDCPQIVSPEVPSHYSGSPCPAQHKPGITSVLPTRISVEIPSCLKLCIARKGAVPFSLRESTSLGNLVLNPWQTALALDPTNALFGGQLLWVVELRLGAQAEPHN